MVAKKRCVRDLTETDLRGKKALVRVDFDVPLDDNLNISDNTKLKAALPTIQYLIRHGAKVILATHLGNPEGVTPNCSLKPLVPTLSDLMQIDVSFASDCIGQEAFELVAAIPDGGVVLLENLRFYKEEEKNDLDFAKKLGSLADLYVNDAFRYAHLAHASTEGVTRFLSPSVAGLLMQKELDYLVGAVSNPERPFVAVVCGSKLSAETQVIESLLQKVDGIIIGGRMVFTFHRSQNYSVGTSLVEEDKVALAKALRLKARARRVSLVLPTDIIVADKFAPDANSKKVGMFAMPEGWMGLDIGPIAIRDNNGLLNNAKTVVWYGSMGVFGMEKFANGAQATAEKLAEISGKGAKTIIGGDDLVADVEKLGLADKISHISTGGDAYKALLEGKALRGIVALDDNASVYY
ncbi:hypothetical protein MKW94_025160 [Papaver nudicaule]|uniref:Phosphoglycerate kinase n=1 Tax=Papaver nudicaule TaxID=74823 RepID=A0AA42B4B8_PAPNU|nr:hypothetical protein [Papaver nudicaule]